MKKLIILDYFFGEGIGHFERYDVSIAKEALRQGIKTEIWCPEGSNPEGLDFIRDCLKAPSRRTWKDSGTLKRLLFKALSVIPRSFEVRNILRKETDRDSVILIPEIENFFYLYLIPLSFGTVRMTVNPRIVIVIRRDLERDWGYMAYLFPRLCRLLKIFSMNYLSRKKNVFFVSDSELITEELKMEGVVNISTLPIPHLPPRQKGVLDKKRQPEKIVIGYFGGGRFEQGFDIVPETIKGTLEAFPDLNINFIIQTGHAEGTGQAQKAGEELGRLKELYTDKIEILSGYLPNDKYEEYMIRCHLILIPYRRNSYGKRTSGILTEAIACGAWCIVPSGTWMAMQKERYEKIITFDELCAKALVDAIGYCVSANKKIDEDKVNIQIDNWYAFHTPIKYITAMKSIVR